MTRGAVGAGKAVPSGALATKMQIVFNGEARDVPEGLTVASLLRHLGLPQERLAVERNLALVPLRDWDNTPVAAGDRFEVVRFVGGGA